MVSNFDPVVQMQPAVAAFPPYSLGACALAYAQAGYKVIPLNPDCPSPCIDSECKKPKQPLGALVPHGLNDATSDTNRIAWYWTQRPDANIGIACQASDIVVIDIDTHRADANGPANFAKLQGTNQLVGAPMQLTPGGTVGGLHVIYKHPQGGNVNAEITPGVETKSKGYIVASPSMFHGKPYMWVEGKSLLELIPAELPLWLAPLVVREMVANTQESIVPSRAVSERDRALALEALSCIPPGIDYQHWNQVGMALHAAGFDLTVFDTWSKKSDKYKEGECERKWASYNGTGITIGTLFYLAGKYGFRFSEGYFPRTDAGNATRYAFNFGHLVRWYKAEKAWLVWDGKRWQADNKEQPVAYAKKVGRIIYDEAQNSDERKHAVQSESKGKIEAMLQLAKPDLAITADMLDRDVFLLNCNNGTIDLRTGELRPHKQEDFITKLAPVDYDPTAKAPRFMQFLSEIFQGSASLIDFVHCALGLSLTGSMKDHQLFIPYGSGANGKSTLMNAVRDILGDYAQEADPTVLITQHKDGPSEGIYRLRGARFVTTVESDEGVSLNEAKVKHLTGGDRLIARPLHGHFAEFNPTHKLWLATNYLPHVKSQGYAMWRRIRLIPFAVQVPEHLRDRDLPDKLRAEYPGILAWLVEGCLKWWHSGGLPEAAEVMRATDEYKDNEDVLAKFIEAHCYEEPSAKVQASLLREDYVNYCRDNNEVPLNKNTFAARLRDKKYTEVKSGVKYWIGVGLRCQLNALLKALF